MTRIIAVAVPKGGAGKTSTTLNLGAALAGRGHSVLLVDFDPQGNLSLSLRATPGSPSLYNVIREFIATWDPLLNRVIQPSSIPNVDVVPTDIWLNEADEELRGADRREYVLQKLVEPVPRSGSQAAGRIPRRGDQRAARRAPRSRAQRDPDAANRTEGLRCRAVGAEHRPLTEYLSWTG